MDPFLGEIRMVGWNFAANGWALCNGQLMSISQNAALFSLLGTTYGGDGVQTFALPNLQGRVPIHQGNGNGLSPYIMGDSSGSETVTLTPTQIPAHNHLMGVSNLTGTVADPTNAILAQGNSGTARAPVAVSGYVSTAATGTLAPAAISMTGGSQAHNNLQPYLCVNFIIALQGVFPSRQ
ncbi:MAG TPA: tail fiber protein [Edaphobacter sp.]|uniref:phage tail protein n=1 Tax=Edaphobacter sp. TaxID=1934404 RepID=UPI002C16CD06|nr:tail fiber protein [Edaphobacter sp.]HUZ96192.1 tail fiber protein [Edaphobacter sp.]